MSSNRELAQAGPSPFSFVVYGVEGALAEYIEEQPVALAIIWRLPKS
ncbi:hypothetical protein PORCAN_495 [Porphyromonas crevioricanis JCM 13913]|nr:hypothetical protein PORCAN_495 [Porphyromonas crevioricanis JCM 13913]